MFVRCFCGYTGDQEQTNTFSGVNADKVQYLGVESDETLGTHIHFDRKEKQRTVQYP